MGIRTPNSERKTKRKNHNIQGCTIILSTQLHGATFFLQVQKTEILKAKNTVTLDNPNFAQYNSII